MSLSLMFVTPQSHKNAWFQSLLPTAHQMHTTSHACLPRFGPPSSPDNEVSHLRPSCLQAIKHLAQLVDILIPALPSVQVHGVHSAQHYAHPVQSLMALLRPQSRHIRLPLQTPSTPSPHTCLFRTHMTPSLPQAPVATPVLSSLMLQPHPPWPSTMDPTESGKSARPDALAPLYAIA